MNKSIKLYQYFQFIRKINLLLTNCNKNNEYLFLFYAISINKSD